MAFTATSGAFGIRSATIAVKFGTGLICNLGNRVMFSGSPFSGRRNEVGNGDC